MRIAVVDHVGNYGGGSRVVRSLLPALKRHDAGLEIEYFGNPASIRRERLATEFAPRGIRVSPLKSLTLPSSGSYLFGRVSTLVQTTLRAPLSLLPDVIAGDVVREIEHRVRGFDLAFFPWPFLLRVPQLSCPLVGVFHDFNFKYYFSGPFVYSVAQRAQLEREMPAWLETAIPVVSTHFMASELAHFYPQAARRTRVVHLAPLGGEAMVDAREADDIVGALGVKRPYVLYPTHMASHKNVGPLIAALWLLRSQGRDLQLVLTGAGTEAVRGQASAVGVRLDHESSDVKGLGYVPNLQMDSLVQCAAVVVSPSLYEAGNGPGLDAWGRGTPVAMSRIPAFVEHVEQHQLRAQLFDPRSPTDIAEKIAGIIDDPVQARHDAEQSRIALGKLTWDQTAGKYLAIFRETAALAR